MKYIPAQVFWSSHVNPHPTTVPNYLSLYPRCKIGTHQLAHYHNLDFTWGFSRLHSK